MKTTFKKVFDEFDDELMNIDELIVDESIDIDIDKIKGEALMSIEDKNSKKKSGKKLITLLVAAAIVIAGTVGAFATGSVQSIFKELFDNSGMNSAGLYDGGNVELVSGDDSLNVELLGVTGDGEKLYSAIEITKKDGSAVIDEDYEEPFCWTKDVPMPIPEDKVFDDYLSARAVYTDKNGNSSRDGDSGVTTLDTIRYSLSEDNKSIKMFVFSRIGKGDLEGGRVTVTSESVIAYKIYEVIDEVDRTGKSAADLDSVESFDDELIERRLQELGITEDDCAVVEKSGKRYRYCRCDEKVFDLPFEISFDLNYKSDGIISRELTVDDAPNVILQTTDKAIMKITPFSVYLYGQCDKETAKKAGWSEERESYDNYCFENIGWVDTSKIELNDGTVYYLYPDEGFDQGIAEDGKADYYEEKIPFNLSTVVGAPLDPEINVIDTREIKTVMLNGDILYSK